MYKIDEVELTEAQAKAISEQYNKSKEYPRWFKDTNDSSIWKFDNLNNAECVKSVEKSKVGVKHHFKYMPHTYHEWTEIPEPDFWYLVEDKQPIYCWNNHFEVAIRFADTKNKWVYGFDGSRHGRCFDNYSITYPKEYIEEMQKKLDGYR